MSLTMIKKHVSTPSLHYGQPNLTVKQLNVDQSYEDEYTSDPECQMFRNDRVANCCHSASEASPKPLRKTVERKKKRRAPQPPGRSVSMRDPNNRAFIMVKQPSTDTESLSDVVSQMSKSPADANLIPSNSGASFSVSLQDFSSNTAVVVTQISTDSESLCDVSSQSPKSPSVLETAGTSPGQSPRDKSRLKALQRALASPRNVRKNSKKYINQENDGATNFRVRKNATVEPPDFSVWTFVYLPEHFEIGCEFEIDRIAKYDEYLNELLTKTHASQPDFEDLCKASKRVNAMVREREDELRDELNGQSVESVQDRFPNDDLHLCEPDKVQKTRGISTRRKSAPSAVLFKTLGGNRNPSTMGKKDFEVCNSFRHSTDANRMYIMEGPVQFANDTQTQHYLFLFSDLLLIAKQKSNTTFKLKNRIRVCDLWIANCIEEVTETTKLHDRSFVIGWPTKNIVAIFKEPETKDLWLSKLTEQIQEEKLKEEGKTLQLKIVHRKNDTVKTCFIPVTNTNDVKDVLKLCMEQFQIPETEQKDYQLWVLTGTKEGTFYPLIGHEIPYTIKQNHVGSGGDGEGQMGSEMEANNNTNSKCDFFLKHKKSTNKRGQDYSSQGNNKRHRRPAILQIFHRRGREEKSSAAIQTDSNQIPTGKLFGRSLETVCTEGDNPAKPILDLLRIAFHKGACTQGFLRKSANVRQVKNLREKLDSGEAVNLDGCSPLTIGSTFKEYLRSLPKSLLLDDLMSEWTKIGGMEESEEKLEKTKQLLQQLPRANLMLLKYVMCMLYQVLQHSNENDMDGYNLSVCIAPSMLFDINDPVQPITDPKSVFTPRALIEYLIENTVEVFGDDVIYLLGDPLDATKYRTDSGTDTDSMTSVSNELRRDDSSIDSLVDRDLFTGEVDSSPKLANSHLSNLSHDSGLMLSDGQLNDDDCDMDSGDKKLIRSASDYDDYGHHFESSLNPVPPPRSRRKKGFDSLLPNSFDSYHQPMFTGSRFDKQHKFSLSLQPDMVKSVPFGKRMSSDSLQSVEENEENENKTGPFLHHRPLDMGLLVKSASGSHLYLNDEEIFSRKSLSVEGQHNRPLRDRLVRQSSVTDSTPPLSPESKYSYSSSRDSVISDSSAFSRDYSVHSLPDTPEEFPNDKYLGTWDLKNRERSNSNPVDIRTSASYSTGQTSSSQLSVSYSGYNLKSMENMRYLVSPPHSPGFERQSKSTTNLQDLSTRNSFPQTQVEDSVKQHEIASPQISITYCSSGSDERLEDDVDSSNQNSRSIPLEISGSTSPKEISMYNFGLGSPPPHIVLRSLSHHKVNRKTSAPTQGSHAPSLLKVQRSSLDSSQNIVQNTEDLDVSGSPKSRSISLQRSDAHNYDRESKVNVVLTTDTSPSKHWDSVSSSTDLRPAKPPSYKQALQRKFMIENGINFDIPDQVSQRQKEASSRARQLYESSLQKYMSGEGSKCLSVEKTKTVVVEQHVLEPCPETPDEAVEQRAGERLNSSRQNVPTKQYIRSNVDNDDEYVVLAKDPKKLYADSIRLFEQQNEQPRSVSQSRVSQTKTFLQQDLDKSGASHPTSGQLHQKQKTLFPVDTPGRIRTTLSVPNVNLHRSKSDSAGHLNKLSQFRGQLSQKSCEEQKENVQTTRMTNEMTQQLSPKKGYFYHPEEDSEVVGRSVTSVHSTSRVSNISVSNGRASSLQASSCTASSQKTSVTVSNTSQKRNKPERRGSELPWSVSRLKNMFDPENQGDNKTSTRFYSPDESSTNNVTSVKIMSTSRPAPPPYVSPPPFRRLHDNSRMSTSSNSSSESTGVGCSSSTKSKSSRHFGPQSLEYGSFSSSSEDLDTVCYHLTKRESMDYSDQDTISYTDVSYV
ncbi:uncharacterized protein LOC121370590 isoform X2 [Gigantopelta aegis]|uniref:uncharacterized protein LOC121370590 isoform X2 n=1 Tax=Gigantopelta aegis TaxID=1735272 RepID=UPI001B88E561|nr:uncharacterized protein LOC121370590 isoform X2 [Gigantopelta aegis]